MAGFDLPGDSETPNRPRGAPDTFKPKQTALVSRNYTKIDDDMKRAAINKLPDIAK